MQSNKFKTRAELDEYIQAIKKTLKATDTIIGTRKDLLRLHLDDQSTVFGLTVTITDTPTTRKKADVKTTPQRGTPHPYGINNTDLKKPPKVKGKKNE